MQITKAVLALHRFTDGSGNRCNLEHIALMAGPGNSLRAWATDGHRLASLVLPDEDAPPCPILIHREAAKAALRGARRDDSFNVQRSASSNTDFRIVRQSADGARAIFAFRPLVEYDNMPNCDEVTPEPGKVTKTGKGGAQFFGFSARYVGDVATYLKAGGLDATGAVGFDCPKDAHSPMRIEAWRNVGTDSDHAYSLVVTLMPVRVDLEKLSQHRDHKAAQPKAHSADTGEEFTRMVGVADLQVPGVAA